MTTHRSSTAGQTQSPHHGWLASFRIDPTSMRAFVWTGLLLVLMTVIGFGWLMHMVPRAITGQ